MTNNQTYSLFCPKCGRSDFIVVRSRECGSQRQCNSCGTVLSQDNVKKLGNTKSEEIQASEQHKSFKKSMKKEARKMAKKIFKKYQ